MANRHHVVTGAAGFIGSHLVDRLLADGDTVTGIDNFVRGRRENVSDALRSQRFKLIEGDLANDATAARAFDEAVARKDADLVWHMAANSDIPGGVEDPSVDLRDTFFTTYYTLASMRRLRIPRLAFASSSAIYGVHDKKLTEDTGPLFPISNYGAMKLAAEGNISAGVESFLERAYIFRFPNVIGGRATHGVILDLFQKLRNSQDELQVLGDGTQQKPYLHVSELIDAMMFIVTHGSERINCFNIAASDEGATVRFIAETVVGIGSPRARIQYGAGNRGWIGDVPRFSYSTEKLTSFGWSPKMTSTQAVERAAREIFDELHECKPSF